METMVLMTLIIYFIFYFLFFYFFIFIFIFLFLFLFFYFFIFLDLDIEQPTNIQFSEEIEELVIRNGVKEVGCTYDSSYLLLNGGILLASG